jgi:hypothetical protein
VFGEEDIQCGLVGCDQFVRVSITEFHQARETVLRLPLPDIEQHHTGVERGIFFPSPDNA